MACLSQQHTWLSPPTTLIDDEHDPCPSAYRLEKVFPVYAMGTIPDPNPASVLDRADPIWVAVKHEAKLEVSHLSTFPLGFMISISLPPPN